MPEPKKKKPDSNSYAERAKRAITKSGIPVVIKKRIYPTFK